MLQMDVHAGITQAMLSVRAVERGARTQALRRQCACVGLLKVKCMFAECLPTCVLNLPARVLSLPTCVLSLPTCVQSQ